MPGALAFARLNVDPRDPAPGVYRTGRALRSRLFAGLGISPAKPPRVSPSISGAALLPGVFAGLPPGGGCRMRGENGH